MDAVLTCMVEEKIGPGEMNQKLIKLAGEIFQVSGAASFRSPAIALNYALHALNLEEGAGVVVSALAPSWQLIELKRNGYTPIILDVEPDTALVSADSIEEAVKSGGKVIILHETLGFLPDIERVLALGVPVIEDLSHSAGAFCKAKEKPAGSMGVFSILGLEEKDILTSGGGALLLAPERRNASVLKQLYEASPSTDILPDINASLAFIQLKQMTKNMATRKEAYDIYIRSLMQSKHKTIPTLAENENPVYSFPVILNSGAADVRKYASKKNIEIEFAFNNSVIEYLQNTEDETANELTNARSLLLRCVLFPLYPRLGSKNVAMIAKVLATLP